MTDPRVPMLALCIFREASNQSMLGKLLVAQTVKNRVDDPRWPDSFAGVITQSLQFSSFNKSDPNASRWPRDDDPAWVASLRAAECVLQSAQKLTEANHYHTLGVMPAWADSSKIVQREGAHIFYKL